MVRYAVVCGAFLFSLAGWSRGQDAAADDTKSAISEGLLSLFRQIDEFGRDKIAEAKFVEVTFISNHEGAKPATQICWLVEQTGETITVFENDLIVVTYRKDRFAPSPSSWSPAVLRVQSVKDADFEQFCKEVVAPKPPKDDDLPIQIYAPGPSYRLLIAHAAWKHGLERYCNPLIAAGPQQSKEAFAAYKESVLEDLAWMHFLRGVNLLMFADRSEVLSHLRLVGKLSPECKYAATSKDLSERLEKMIAEQANKPPTKVDEEKLSDEERAKLYISQLKDLHAVQFAQPGSIIPYLGQLVTKDDPDAKEDAGAKNTPPQEDVPLPTEKLKKMGMKAVPALLEALEDDTPTRTVYHWRDFARDRVVWRVSDYAWSILRDVTGKDFGDRPVIGFTLSSMKPADKKAVIANIKKWYASNKSLSEDDRMYGFFTSREPRDWMKAADYFLKKNDKRAVGPLLAKIPAARDFDKGDLCEIVAKFGDKKAKETLTKVLKSAGEPADQISAAIGLWQLGDKSGVPVAIDWMNKAEQPYGNWEEPIWFLVWSRSDEGLKAVQEIIVKGPPGRASDVLATVSSSISGDLWGEQREPTGCVEIAPVLIAVMDRKDKAGRQINSVNLRINDIAAKAFVQLRDGTDQPFGGRFFQPDPKVFDPTEADEAKRDKQIDALKQWYEANKERLAWDAEKKKLVVKEPK